MARKISFLFCAFLRWLALLSLLALLPPCHHVGGRPLVLVRHHLSSDFFFRRKRGELKFFGGQKVLALSS